MKTIILFFFLLFATAIHAIGIYCTGDTLHCFAISGLKLRDAPRGKVLTSIPLGGNVIVLDLQHADAHDTFENIAGNWIHVQYGNQNGYVFDGFLSKLPAPSLEDSSMIEYLKRVAKPIGKPFMLKNPCSGDSEGEGTYSINIQIYQSAHLLAKFIDYTGWEWGHNTTVFDYVSPEEIYLLCKVVYRFNLKDTAYPADGGKEIVFKLPDENDPAYGSIIIRMQDEPDQMIQVIEDWGY